MIFRLPEPLIEAPVGIGGEHLPARHSLVQLNNERLNEHGEGDGGKGHKREATIGRPQFILVSPDNTGDLQDRRGFWEQYARARARARIGPHSGETSRIPRWRAREPATDNTVREQQSDDALVPLF